MFDKSLLNAIQSAQQVTVMTGAGISAESGVPTFRQAQTGIWAQFDPAELATPEAFYENPKRVGIGTNGVENWFSRPNPIPVTKRWFKWPIYFLNSYWSRKM